MEMRVWVTEHMKIGIGSVLCVWLLFSILSNSSNAHAKQSQSRTNSCVRSWYLMVYGVFDSDLLMMFFECDTFVRPTGFFIWPSNSCMLLNELSQMISQLITNPNEMLERTNHYTRPPQQFSSFMARINISIKCTQILLLLWLLLWLCIWNVDVDIMCK